MKKNAPILNNRKILRKQKRLQKKIKRQEHYTKKKNSEENVEFTPGRFVRRPIESPLSNNEDKTKKKPSHSLQDLLNKERQKDMREAEKLKSQMDKRRKEMFLKANEEEDKVIKKLEKQLGLNKCKNKKNYFTDDGLDYLLEICDRTTSEQIVAAEKHLADVDRESDFEDDLAAVTRKEIKSNEKTNIGDEKKELSENDNYDDSDISSIGSGDDDDFNEELNDDNDEIMCDHSTSEESHGNASENSNESDMSDIEEGEKADDSSEETLIPSKKSKLTNNKNSQKIDSKNKKSLQSGAKTSKERVINADDLSKVFSDDEISHLSGDENDDMNGISGNDSDNGEHVEKKEKHDIWEDIYGRKRDKEGNVIKEEKGIYVPPHLRNKDASSEKELTQLKRQIKSVLNKLAGTNLHWASSSVEGLYSSNSRNAVNTSLSQLWAEATMGFSHTPVRLIAEHAALVAVLHANVATEIGAHFLQELTKKFDAMMQQPQPMEDKRLDNLVSCLAHLYCFKIYHASLLYDIFGRLVEDLTEKNVECVLLALRSVGGVLRKDEPLALKNFIQETQTRVAKLNEAAADGSRIKFLLEVLMAVKNNNLNKIPNYDPSYVEFLVKQVRTVVRRGNYITPLNIRLEDLLKADERGKWWVVGSAWEGTRSQRDPEQPKPTPAANEKLLRLAREQRMNTDVRRNIFCVIMAAEDYMDAFEKLQHLGLKGQQEREIVHVLLACCVRERNYNPYYAVLAQKLCDTDRKYQLSIQYSSWDKIKELDSMPKYSVANLAQFLVHLILGKGLPLSVLKVIEFSDLNKHSVKFMRQILLAIVLNSDPQATMEAFVRVSKSPKLRTFRESLRLFIQHFLIRNAGKGGRLDDREMALLKERAAEIDNVLTVHESKLRF